MTFFLEVLLFQLIHPSVEETEVRHCVQLLTASETPSVEGLNANIVRPETDGFWWKKSLWLHVR